MRFNDAIFGAFFIVFAIVEIAYTTTFPKLHGQSFGPDLFPIVIGVCLAVCGLVLIVRGLAARAGGSMIGASWVTPGDWTRNPGAVLNFVLIVVAMAVFIPLSEAIGFAGASFIILAILLYRLETPLLPSLVLAVLVTAFIQTLFVKILLVPLPVGPLDIF